MIIICMNQITQYNTTGFCVFQNSDVLIIIYWKSERYEEKNAAAVKGECRRVKQVIE